MTISILEPAEIVRNRFVKGEIEAGLGFAANAIEHQAENPTRARTSHADAEDCYATANDLIGQADSIEGWPLELGTMLGELRRRLDVLRETKLALSATA